MTLRQSPNTMRDAIDKFHADQGRYPEKLEELVEKRYLRAVPVDPVTDSAETWVILPPPDARAQGAVADPRAQGSVYDVRSGAKGNATDGKPFESL